MKEVFSLNKKKGIYNSVVFDVNIRIFVEKFEQYQEILSVYS